MSKKRYLETILTSDVIEIFIPKYIPIAVTIILFTLTGINHLSEFSFNILMLNEIIPNNTTTISIMLIGFYIVIISLLGTNISLAIKKISKEKLGEKFVSSVGIGIISSFLFLILSILSKKYISNEFFMIFFYSSFTFIMARFLSFSLIALRIFEYNIVNSYENLELIQKRNDLMFVKLK